MLDFFLEMVSGCSIIILATCICNRKDHSQKRIPQINIWWLFGLFWVTKTRTKTVNCNSHQENFENFLISDWILRKVEEMFLLVPRLAIILLCYILNLWSISFFKFCSKLHYRYMKVQLLKLMKLSCI